MSKQSSLGRSLIKNHTKKKRVVAKDGQKHTVDLPDGRDWGRLNLHSITEQTNLDEFLDKVQLADKEFHEECLNIKIVSQDETHGMLSERDKALVVDAQEKHKQLLRIPRRPYWDVTMSKEELDRRENETFMEWRKNLALLNEEEHINLTPYERNLEIWRQLWRVIERSDVIVQIIDSRNPLLFRCEDLETYAKEIDPEKLNVLLLNKADFLTQEQRKQWANYFSSIGVKVVFFSALQQMGKDDKTLENSDSDEGSSESESETAEAEVQKSQDSFAQQETGTEESDSQSAANHSEKPCHSGVSNSSDLVSKEELVLFLKNLGQKVQKGPLATIGLVGYPNVGKSSTINAVLMSKKVSVSSTPGKTKHFQTLMVDPELCFCDCPGLVFPNFVSTKADMVINGILPIDQLTSHLPPVTLVANLIPRKVLESTYSIMLPLPGKDEDPLKLPTAEELLNAHGYMRGFMTHRGLPDTARSARYVLKDFVNGKLLYCHAPPGVKQEEYHEFSFANVAKPKVSGQTVLHALKSNNNSDNVDKEFFKTINTQIHYKGVIGPTGKLPLNISAAVNNSKNSKHFKRHHNRNTKKKLRNVYSYLDQ